VRPHKMPGARVSGMRSDLAPRPPGLGEAYGTRISTRPIWPAAVCRAFQSSSVEAPSIGPPGCRLSRDEMLVEIPRWPPRVSQGLFWKKERDDRDVFPECRSRADGRRPILVAILGAASRAARRRTVFDHMDLAVCRFAAGDLCRGGPATRR